MKRHRLPHFAATVLAIFPTCSANCLAGGFQPGEFITWSQENWGATPSPGNAAQLLAERFDLVYPGGLEVGVPGSSGHSMFFTSAAAIRDFLPASGINGPLNNDLLDPTSSASGEFGGHVVALQLNVDFNDSGDLTGSSSVPFGDLVLANLTELPQYNGLTVRQFLVEQNGVLGGVLGVDNYDAVSFLAQDITRAFEGGTPSQFAQDHLIIPGDCPGNANADAAVDVDDLIAVILAWGACPNPPAACDADVDDSGAVDVDDLITVILNWGECD